jgi:hypothetical protein
MAGERLEVMALGGWSDILGRMVLGLFSAELASSSPESRFFPRMKSFLTDSVGKDEGAAVAVVEGGSLGISLRFLLGCDGCSIYGKEINDMRVANPG